MSNTQPPRSAKARRLAELAARVDVPRFEVLTRGQAAALTGEALLVRGCSVEEDGAQASHAGRSLTVGPVSAAELPAALGRVFDDPRVQECVVQEWVDGPSGVALALGEGRWLVEYARVAGGVTAGRVSPYCALLPDEGTRHAALQRELAVVGAAFGACDVEFVHVDSPRFVQVRPLTAPVSCDLELVRIKQALQELDEPHWRQDDFCTDLMERPEQDAAWIALFLATVAETYARCTGARPSVGPRDFLKLGRQLFRSEGLALALRPGARQAFRIGLGEAGLLQRAQRVLADEGATPAALMDLAIELNLHAELPTARLPGRARRLFALREGCRQRLAQRLPQGSRAPDIEAPRRLAPELLRDEAGLRWIHAAWHTGAGHELVPGAPAAAPVQRYARRPEAVRAGVLLHTEELYPELAEVLGRVAGIVCAGGGVGSHLAILCREARVPLRIQVGEAALAD